MDNVAMGAFIAEHRHLKGLTQKQLAEQLNITDKAVSKWERGKGCPDISLLDPLARALDVPVDALLQSLRQGALQNGVPAAAPDEEDAPPCPPNGDGPVKGGRWRAGAVAGWAFSVLVLLAMFVCMVVDLAISHRLTWSRYPLSALAFSWLAVMPVLVCTKHRLNAGLVSVSLFILPFLYVLEKLTGGGWFRAIGMPIALLSLGALWAARLIFATSMHLWYKLGFVLLLEPVMNLGTGLVLWRALGESIDDWDFFSMLAVTLGAVLLFGAGRLHQKKKGS